MFRRSAPRLAMVALVSAAVLPLAVSAGAETPRRERTVRVVDFAFNPVPVNVEAGETAVWLLDQSAANPHKLILDVDGNGDFDDNDDGSWDFSSPELNATFTVFRHPFDVAGQYQYFCEYHVVSNAMVGRVDVKDPPPTTTTTVPPTTTTTVPPTTTTTAPIPTTTTTRPRATTTTTQPPASTPTTEPPASASSDKPNTTSTTAKATTTQGKPTTTTGKKKPASTTTTKAPETTTTSAPPALPADWIPTPDIVPDGSPTTTTTGPDLQAAADHRPKSGKSGKGGGGSGLPVTGAAALAVLLLGGGGWAWYHRSSRYLPA